MEFNAAENSLLHLLIKSPAPGAVVTLAGGGETRQKSAFCALTVFSLQQNTSYTLRWEGCEIGFAYCYDPQTVLGRGIDIVVGRGGAGESPYEERYHFTPPVGWLNDPNGLCWQGGLYHLYYQFYPHAQRWGNMHWGHAVSGDLMHWRHMPVFLTPQQSLVEDSSLVGGAFSGSAVVCDEGIRFYLTRHEAKIGDEDATMREWQTTLLSTDGVSPREETTIVENQVPGQSCHFRDPKVFQHQGRHYMVLGSALEGVAGLMLYTAADGLHWQYAGPVLSMEDPACVTVECPDMFPLDGAFVCVAAKMCVVDQCGRINPVQYNIGDFDGQRFVSRATGLYDFGASFYAVQSFEHGGRRIAFGWMSDFYNEHRLHENGVCGSMSLPRELHVKNGVLYQKPVAEVYACRGELLYRGGGEALNLQIEGGAWYARLDCEANADFAAVLNREGGDEIRFVSQGGSLFLHTTRAGGLMLKASCTTLTSLEIFVDRRTVEVFLNDGEAAGAKTFYTGAAHGVFALQANCPHQLKEVQVYKMNETKGDCRHV